MDSESPAQVFNSFKASSKTDWVKVAQLELEGADPFQKLSFQTGGLSILPYYDAPDKVGNSSFQIYPSQNEFLGARGWHNMPSIDVATASKANGKALLELNSGADGIFFDFKTEAVSVFRLIEKIEWPYCSISFRSNTDNPLKELHALAVDRKYDLSSLTGCFFGSNSIDPGTISLFEDWANFHPMGIEVAPKEHVDEEIATALAQAVKGVDLLTNHRLSLKSALRSIAFKVEATEDFFLTVAKLKALRFLWQNIATAFDKHSDTSIFIHATSPAWNKKEYQPNGNMLKGTTAALSAILGGCDALTVFPEEHQNSMKSRIAKNISSILREESHLSAVADPSAGSYYLESLIDQLSESAWRKFQKMIG